MKNRTIKGVPRSPPRKPRGADGAPRAAANTSPKSGLSSKEKTVLRDIWIYAGGLFLVTATVGLLMSSFSPLILAPVALVCVVGAVLLHLATLDRFFRARRNGTQPDTTRIFD